MLHKCPLWKTMVLALCMMMFVVSTPLNDAQIVSAATVCTFSSTTKALVCGTQAKIKLPKGWSNCKFTSSNKKVATVTSKGIVKAVRLGVAKITVKSGSKKKIYTITVTPKNESEVWLNQEAILTGQKLQFSLDSDKYDTSQVKLTFSCGYSEISNKGKCTGIENSGGGDLYYSYGLFKKHIHLVIWDPDDLFAAILGNEWYEDTDACNVYAGDPYTIIVSLGWDETVKQISELRKQGISVLLDGTEMEDTVVFTPGVHELSLISGNVKYKKMINVSYSVKNALIKRDATGFSTEAKAVFDAAFSTVEQVVRDGMSDSEKVKAIHDYLIYHANYVNNGDYSTAERWAYGAEGVLLHREGVCQSYAIAFYMMATAAGVDCEFVTGVATNSVGSTGGHAWNRVLIDNTWYYIDCTWDDPTGGGHERYTYYLSETLWANHTVEEIKDLADEEKYMWEKYYLTGAGYHRN